MCASVCVCMWVLYAWAWVCYFACEFILCVRVCVELSLVVGEGGGGDIICDMSVVVTVGFLALVVQPVLPSYSPPPPSPGGNC